MKNWILAIAILVLPLITYFVLEKTNTNAVNFEAQAKTGKASVIKFYSPMCLDCKKLETVVNEVMPKYTSSVTYQSINGQSADKEVEALVKKYNVTLVPTMVFIKKDGSLYKRTEGALTKNELENILNGLIK